MPLTPRTFNAVLFDLDGTLVDNMRYHIDAWIEIGRELGKELSREQIMRDFSGRKNEELLPMVAGRALDSAELAQLAARNGMQRLAAGDKVTSAALEAGYNGVSAFISAFRQAFGVTPGNYLRASNAT